MRLFAALATAPTSLLTVHVLLFGLPSAIADEQNGLKIEVTKAVDCVRKTHNGDELSMNYRGTLQSDGTEFDSSIGRSPFSFTLGQRQVIRGWDQGLLDMCIGERRRLTIPPALAYGNRRTGKIPAGSTLVFDTELMSIKGVKAEPLPSSSAETPTATSTLSPSTTATSTPTEAAAATEKGSPEGPEDDEPENSGECKLLGPFALLVQGALGGLAVLVLVFKRLREDPQRPVKIWFFDVSKQVVGSVLLHLANLFMSMLSSGDLDLAAKATETTTTVEGKERQLNPCSFYLLNLAIDTTIGIPILVLLLRFLHIAFAYTPLANPPESLKSGNYGQPPHATWWLKQSFIYFIGLFGMKTCVFILFQLLPWLAWVGDWALRWTEGNEAIQITFVMLVFPLIMNAIQYWIIDSFIKDPAGSWQNEALGREDAEEEEGLVAGGRGSEDSEGEGIEAVRKAAGMSSRQALKEANPTPIDAEYDPERDGEASRIPPGEGKK